VDTGGTAAGDSRVAIGGRPEGRARSLAAPHRRATGGSRLLERATVRAYRAAAWLLSHLPPRPSWIVIGWFSKAGYLLWPTKRRWVDANFWHVLGRPASRRGVRRLALRAYGHYAQYLVELMRLPSLLAEERAALVEPEVLEELEAAWRSSNGLILCVGHLGNNEACAAGVASRGWPVSAVADDSSFPEMFELLRRQRGEWGVTLIPWRNLRAAYGVLRRREMLALLVDWGYRADGIPVRLFGSWTALPAGPAALAAKTGATLLPITIRRVREGRFRATLDAPIEVPSGAPADLQRATQAMAAALERGIAAAPDQWYSFKPIWPETAEEEASLAARAAAMQADSAAMLAGSPDGADGAGSEASTAHGIGSPDASTTLAEPA
jgi:lauroyl/myristoyl acyltransferase